MFVAAGISVWVAVDKYGTRTGHAIVQTVNGTLSLQNSSSLADVTSIDLPSTISKYTQTQYSLQASQQAFVQVQQMSLFQYLNQ